MKKADLPLDEIQSKFAAALLDADLVPQALPLFSTQSNQLSGRLALYRGNLSAAWYNALANAYPVLLQLVGVDFFEQMARAYGCAFPSQLGDLNHFGSDLPSFLATAPMTSDYPYFTDVAALEWQVHRSYYACDADVLTLPALLAEAGQNLQEVRLQWHPVAQLHESSCASVSVWLAHQGDPLEYGAIELSGQCYGLVTREEWLVNVHPIKRAAYLALQALSQGQSLGQALELAIEGDAEFDIAVELKFWLSAGVFSATL